MFNKKKQNISRFGVVPAEITLDNFKQKRYVDIEGMERCVGFVDFVDHDTEFKNPINYGQYICVSLCVGKRSVPSKLVATEYNQALKELEKQFKEAEQEVTPSTKKELKKAIKARLLREVKPILDYVDVVYNTETYVLYFFSANNKDIDSLMALYPLELECKIGWGNSDKELDSEMVEKWCQDFLMKVWKGEVKDCQFEDKITLTDYGNAKLSTDNCKEFHSQIDSCLTEGSPIKQAELWYQTENAAYVFMMKPESDSVYSYRDDFEYDEEGDPISNVIDKMGFVEGFFGSFDQVFLETVEGE